MVPLVGRGCEDTRFGGGVGRLAEGLKDKPHAEKGREWSMLFCSVGTSSKRQGMFP